MKFTDLTITFIAVFPAVYVCPQSISSIITDISIFLTELVFVFTWWIITLNNKSNILFSNMHDIGRDNIHRNKLELKNKYPSTSFKLLFGYL